MAQSRRRPNPALTEWVRGFYGVGKRFSSGRSLSIATGRNENTVARLEESGHATAEVIVDIARTVGTDPLDALVLVGLLQDDEVAGGADNRLTVEEQDLLQCYRRTTPSLRLAALATVRELSNIAESALPTSHQHPAAHQGLESL